MTGCFECVWGLAGEELIFGRQPFGAKERDSDTRFRYCVYELRTKGARKAQATDPLSEPIPVVSLGRGNR
jgi:hypothetical protein